MFSLLVFRGSYFLFCHGKKASRNVLLFWEDKYHYMVFRKYLMDFVMVNSVSTAQKMMQILQQWKGVGGYCSWKASQSRWVFWSF